ncbi:unnamed protein product [Calicophoron daubneyi]|uniref:Myb-like domain-containing protein n=1 Tax=Calicophoron daubneyi TaxID=300641 RepID=A0AAV2TLS7_CALDB
MSGYLRINPTDQSTVFYPAFNEGLFLRLTVHTTFMSFPCGPAPAYRAEGYPRLVNTVPGPAGQVGNDILVERNANQQPHEVSSSRWNSAELEALLAVVVRTNDFLVQTKRSFNRKIWTEIANAISTFGWPQRSWSNVKDKGEELLRDSETNGQSLTESSRSAGTVLRAVTEPINFPVASTLGLVPRTTHSSDDGVETADIVSINHGYTCTDISDSRRQPPPLIPSSEATASLIMLRQSCGDPRVCNPSLPSVATTTGPQILNVCSKTTPAISVTSTLAGIDPLVVPSGCTSTELHVNPPTVGLISQCSSSNNTGQMNLPTIFSQSGNAAPPLFSNIFTANTTPYQPPRAVEQPHIGYSPVPNFVSTMPEREFARRMEIYKQEEEALLVKRAYWISKLGRLSQNEWNNLLLPYPPTGDR